MSANVAEIVAKLGIAGVDPTKLAAVMELVELVGSKVSIDPEGVKAYLPDVDENFYYNAQSLRDASRLGDMRSLTTVNLGPLLRAQRWPKQRCLKW